MPPRELRFSDDALEAIGLGSTRATTVASDATAAAERRRLDHTGDATAHQARSLTNTKALLAFYEATGLPPHARVARPQIADSARRRIKEKSLVRKSVSFMRKSLRIPGGRATKFTREQTAV